jgi:predicted DNA-binding antitoxin AbrB/MazE fold protein
MSIHASAIYRNGVLQPTKTLPLAEDERVELTIVPPSPVDDQISIDEFFRLADELAFDNEVPGLPRDFSSADVYLDHD